METKFYVGQKVKVVDNDWTYTYYEQKFIELGFVNKKHNPEFRNGQEGVIFATTRQNVREGLLLAIRADDGRECLISCDGVSVIYPEPFRLTEWQKDRVKELVDDIYNNKIIFHTSLIEKIESILSEPEPPKYQPKQGDAVLVRNNKQNEWSAKVATGYGYDIYGWRGEIVPSEFCRPFDPDLVGKVTD